MSIAKTTDKFPPDQVKEGIGLLRIAMAKSTDPANKISLCDSRIRTLMGVMEHKCHDWVQPGLTTLLLKAIEMMLADMRRENPADEVASTIDGLVQYVQEVEAKNVGEKSRFVVTEGLDILSDYNVVIECRQRWKEASDMYMANRESWSISNKMLADVGDKLEAMELKYNLIIMPKNYSYDINDLGMFNKPRDE